MGYHQRSSQPGAEMVANGCFAFLFRPCTRGCFSFHTVFARHVGLRLPKAGDSDTDSDHGKDECDSAAVMSDGVRPAMASVYIDGDTLLRPMAIKKQNDFVPLSTINGAEELPNSHQEFFEARHEAAQQRKWFIVNLQHPENSRCARLNTDVWSRPEFCNGIFIHKASLWQRDVGHFQTEKFIAYYCNGQMPSAEECPLVMILDPRTGRALRRWKAGPEDFPIDLHEALQRMNTFFDTHTLDGFSPPESPQQSPQASPQLSADFRTTEVDIEGFEEITLTEACLGDEVAKTDDGQSSICGPFWDVVETDASSGSASPAVPFSTKKSMTMSPSTSCSSGEAPVQLLLRLPDGVRCEQKFSADEPLSNVLDFAAQCLRKCTQDAHVDCTAADILLDISTPLGQESLHAMPTDTPVGGMDVHRKVLNVRLRSQT